MNPHTTNDDPRRYRLGSEAETWKLKDPLERVRAYLAREVGYSADFFSDLEAEADTLAERIRTGCRTLVDPTPASVFEHVNVTMSDELQVQRDEFVSFVEEVSA